MLRLASRDSSSPGSFATRLERKEYQQHCHPTSRANQTRTIKVFVSDMSRPIVLGLMSYERAIVSDFRGGALGQKDLPGQGLPGSDHDARHVVSPLSSGLPSHTRESVR